MDDPREADLDHVNLRLTKGLKACRTIVSNYRAMIAGEDESDAAIPPPEDSEEEQ